MASNRETSASQSTLYLKKVRIRNYAPLLDATTSFQRGLNIIIGSNGTGKTRFLTLASRLLRPFDSPDIGVDSELTLGYDKDIKVWFQDGSSIREDDLTHTPHALARSELDIKTEVKVLYRKKESSGSDLEEALFRVGIDVLFGLVLEPILAKHGTPLQQIALVDVPATLTFKIPVGRVSVTPEVDFQLQLPAIIVNTIGHSFARYNRSQRVSKSPLVLTIDEARIEVERITAAFLDFLNPYIARYSPILQIRLSNTYQIYDNAAQKEVIVKGLVFEYLIGESWLPFSALSDGTKRILYLITQLVMPTARFEGEQPLPTPFTLELSRHIIFLEEPELGIHPHQLHKLLYLIKEVASENQIILTTHAPQVLDMLGADELDRITVCSLDPEKGTQFHKLTEEKQEQARVYMKEVGFLSDYWRYSYLEETEAE